MNRKDLPSTEDAFKKAVEAEVATVLASTLFARAPGLARFLAYLCGKALAGKTGEVKEYTIGVEALGRGPDFSPKDDPIVRVEANRLRKRLKEYYETDGAGHEIQIQLLPGSYLPSFILPESTRAQLKGTEAAGPQPSRFRRVQAAILSGKGILIAAGMLVVSLALLLTSGPGDARSAAPPPPGESTAPQEEVRIMAGSTAVRYIDHQGYTWQGDEYFSGGNAGDLPHALRLCFGSVSRTKEPQIYRYRREGDFEYSIPLKPGMYELRLHFVEFLYGEDQLEGGGEGSRLMNVYVNDRMVLSGFDILADTGEPVTADVKVFTDISPRSDGMLHLRFQSLRSTALVNAIEILPGIPGKMRPVRISTQPNPVFTADRSRWDADCFYRGGRSMARGFPIQADSDPELYQTERYGSFTYCIPVAADGTYTIRLRFSENYFGDKHPSKLGVGQRIFDVFCNGEVLLSDFDIMGEAGGSQRGLEKVFRGMRPKAQGKFLLSFLPVKNYATVSAIEVIAE